MGSSNLYSIRMRASCAGRHVSGAERIVPEQRVAGTIEELIARAKGRRVEPDRIVVTLDRLDRKPRLLPALDVASLGSPDVSSCRVDACRALGHAGVSEEAARKALDLLSRGAAPSGENMRGAMIMDARTAERLEPDQERGIRVSRFDWSGEALEEVKRLLSALGLTHFRTWEALALATKVAHAPSIVAELCWSDEPDYTAGYVASPCLGYVRFPHLKPQGDPRGGRVFFVRRDGFDLDVLITYLQQEPVLITPAGACGRVASLQEFLASREQVSLHV